MQECLDEQTILALCRGSIAPAARPRVEEHLAGCDECRVLVSAVARSSLAERREAADPAMAPTTPAEGLGSGLDAAARGPVAAPVQPGELLAGKFVVERVLGAGGMGVVVAARHTQLDQRFALKFLLPAACEQPGAIARFLREGKAAARITSEHVARVVDTGVLPNGAPYLVMEYLEGADLGALARGGGPLPSPDAIEYVLQACEAIVEAHQLGIVHRDLKPANLFLARRSDGSPLVKVLDFGISKADGGSHARLTSTSMLMGSPRYMSPEQMLSAKDVDARTDVWALGVILYELVTGEPVWQADTVQGLCALVTSAPAPSLRERAPHAPPLLEAVVAACLAKSPAERLPTVADLALALAPIAPPAARLSIDRILRVAGRAHLPSSAPAHPSAATPPGIPSAAVSAASPSRASSSGGKRVALLLAFAVFVVAIVGFAIQLAEVGGDRRRGAPAAAAEDLSAAATATAVPSADEPAVRVVESLLPAADAAAMAAAAPTAAHALVPATEPSAPAAGPRARVAAPPPTRKDAPRATAPRPVDPGRPPLLEATDAPNRALIDRK